MGDFMFAEVREKNQFNAASIDLENFFNKIYADGKMKATINGIKLVYRIKQYDFADQIMNAIKDNQILIVQAGVGIGKTFGYLFPIFYTYKNVKRMKHFVISTSNIGLQQQLLTDINAVSNLLDIKLKAVIAKGINNYACINRIQHALHDSRNSFEEKKVINELLSEIEKKGTIDKDELKQVSNEVWELVKFKNRGACSNCVYSRRCLYRKIAYDIDQANIVVTNHNILAKAALEGRDFFKRSDAFIFDESHKLEEAIQSIQGGTIDFDSIKKTLAYYIDNHIINSVYESDYVTNTIYAVRDIFKTIKRRGSGFFYKNKNEQTLQITDCDKIPFSVGKMENDLLAVIKRLNAVLSLVKNANRLAGYRGDYREEYLKNWIDIFGDMLLESKNKSQNIYWINFFKDNSIVIGYTNKKNSGVIKKILEKKVPIAFTSGTLLDLNGTYNYFIKTFSLDEVKSTERSVKSGKVCSSPYDYKTHSLFYYDKNISDPNENHQKYLDELVIKITELLKITDGRTLVLFTSKSDMNYVYEHLDKSDFNFEIFLQGQDKSNSQLYNDFGKNHKSCLFSTAAWEGLDVKGISLSNVIITRLPFATDNAIMQYKQREFAKICDNSNNNDKEDKSSVFLNDMLQKFAQGAGRLIRSHKDWGLVCCLDSRFDKYKDYIHRFVPFVNYTDNIDDVCVFASNHITNRGRPRKLVKKEDN